VFLSLISLGEGQHDSSGPSDWHYSTFAEGAQLDNSKGLCHIHHFR